MEPHLGVVLEHRPGRLELAVQLRGNSGRTRWHHDVGDDSDLDALVQALDGFVATWDVLSPSPDEENEDGG